MLRNSVIGDVFIELSEIDSTNNYAMQLINEGMAEHGMCIRADFQTHGKGQLGNTWQAEESKNLLFSIILDTQGFSLQKQFELNAVACISMAELLMTSFTMKDICIKWPNDIYAEGKKIAGILIENNIRGTAWSNAVIGIGLNVNQQTFIDVNRATSMYLLTGKTYKLNMVLKPFLKIFNQQFKKFQQNVEIIELYNSMLMNVGKTVMFKRNHEMYSGLLHGVDKQGNLEMSVQGKMKSFKHREVELMLD